MGAVVEIFKKLQVDETIFYQFFIFLILFVILKPLLFDKLLFVIQMREGKTTKLEGHADKKFAKSEKLAEEYNEKIKSVNSKAHKKFHDEKVSIEKEQKEKISKFSKELEGEIQARREKFAQEFEKREKDVTQKVDGLTDKLVNKLVQ